MMTDSGKAEKEKFWIGPDGKERWAMPWMANFPPETYPDKPVCPTDFLPNPAYALNRNGWILQSLHKPEHAKSFDKRLAEINAAQYIEWARKDPDYLNKQHVLSIRHLVHATHMLQASKILQPDGSAVFIGNPFSDNGYDGSYVMRKAEADICRSGDVMPDGSAASRGCTAYEASGSCTLTALGPLIWFGVDIATSDDERKSLVEKIRQNVRDHHVSIDKDDFTDERLSYYATSPLLSGESYYGNFAFSTSVNDFMTAVNRCFGDISAEPQAKRVCPGDNSLSEEQILTCFHVGGTLFYQSEVAYVVIIAAKNRCAELKGKGLPCLGDNKTLALGERLSLGEGIDCSSTVEIHEPSEQVPIKLNEIGQNCPAKLYVKSSTPYVRVVHDDVDLGDGSEPYEWKTSWFPYWEQVVFAVMANKLSFEANEVRPCLVDHTVSVCQPSLRQHTAKGKTASRHKNCQFGGYADKNDLEEALGVNMTIIQQFQGTA